MFPTLTRAPFIGPRTRFNEIFDIPRTLPLVDVDNTGADWWPTDKDYMLCECGNDDCAVAGVCLAQVY